MSRLLGRAKGFLGTHVQTARAVFRNRMSSAKRLARLGGLARQIAEQARLPAQAGRRGQEAEGGRRATYQRLLEVAEATLKQARLGGQAETIQAALAETSATATQRLRESLGHFAPLLKQVRLGGQVITQTRRRVLDGQMVPGAEKLVSLFEPHTRVIRRGKMGKPTEFGRKVWLDEVDGGIVSRYRVLQGNPRDDREVPMSLANHQRLFGRPPDLFTGDRGVHSPENEVAAYQTGVKRVALPQPGAKSAEHDRHERQGWFRHPQRFRAGIEGRISVLKRRGYLGALP